MGVPSFYRWLVNKYPKVVAKAIHQDSDTTATYNPNGIEFDNLYLDMNGIIHPCFLPELDDNSAMRKTFEQVFENIFSYIDRLVSIVRPRKLLYMAIDGVAPRAKMNQQRARRFRTAKDNDLREVEEERLRKQFEMQGKQVLPKQESQVSDSNIITPGTDFMLELSKALQSYVISRIACHSLWSDIKVILSDANVPGEGEHKIMSYVRNQRSLSGYDPNTRHCLYGLDADLIMLAMATHEPHFSILREDVLQEQQQVNHAGKPFEFLHVWLLREYLELDLKIENPLKNLSIDFERILDDFIFICFFAGNDFLPHMPSLEIHEGAIDLLMSVYKRQFSNIGGYLVDMSRVSEKKAAFVKLSRVERFILMVGTHEEKIFTRRSEIRDRKLRRLVSDYEKQDEFDEDSTDSVIVEKAAVDNISSAEILKNTKALKDQVGKCIRQKSDLVISGEFLVDRIKLGTCGGKERYYKEKFSVEGPTDIESKRKEIVHKYTEGLVWVLKYYYSGVPSWNWFYPYHYGPFASDLRGMGQVRINFEKGVPFLPFDQLLSVLPPRSAHALPDSYAKLMLDEKSPIIEFYPLDFEVDTDGKRFMWQTICKLPFIEERRLLAETMKLKDGLSEDESVRNSVKIDTLFVRSSSSLGTKICSVNRKESNPSFKLEASNTSDGIGGTISLGRDGLDKPCLGIERCHNEPEHHVLCVCYELCNGSSHIPRLLSGVKMPTKAISEVDIMETVLWHERPQQNGFGRGANKWNSCSKYPSDSTAQYRRGYPSNQCPQFSYKGAGTGWGTSSGRGHHGNAVTDTRSQQFPRPIGSGDHFHSSRNGSSIASNNAFHRGPHSETRPHIRGRGTTTQRGSRSYANQWTSVDNQECVAEECFARVGRAELIAEEYITRTRIGTKKSKGKALLDDY